MTKQHSIGRAEREKLHRDVAIIEADPVSARTAPKITQKDVEILMDSMSPEGRAHVAMMAVHRAGIRPATWPK
jgi:hypothetical protein